MRKVIDAKPYDSDKSQTFYLEIYEEYFEPFVNKEMKLLELGVYKGGSLLLWRDYFEKGTIVGLDINPVSIEDPSGRIHVYQGYQQDTKLLDRIAMEQAPDGFDVIIDDCSHMGELTRISFWHLFENHLKPGGIYAIEDFGVGYLDDWPDGKSLELGVNDKPFWLRSCIIPAMQRAFNRVLYLPCPPRLKPRLQQFVSSFGTRSSRVANKKIIPSHMYGMVGFVKELVDACSLNAMEAHWGGGPRRPSNIARLHISPSLAIAVKSQQ